MLDHNPEFTSAFQAEVVDGLGAVAHYIDILMALRTADNIAAIARKFLSDDYPHIYASHGLLLTFLA